jgi:hypothetical protein
MFGNNWHDDHLKVGRIDSAAHTVSTTSEPGYAFKVGQPFYFYDLLEELTAPRRMVARSSERNPLRLADSAARLVRDRRVDDELASRPDRRREQGRGLLRGSHPFIPVTVIPSMK